MKKTLASLLLAATIGLGASCNVAKPGYYSGVVKDQYYLVTGGNHPVGEPHVVFWSTTLNRNINAVVPPYLYNRLGRDSVIYYLISKDDLRRKY